MLETITKDKIRAFVQDFYGIENLFIKTQNAEFVQYKRYFIWLCYEYSDDVVNSSSLKRYMNISQHGTILSALENVIDFLKWDKRTQKELSALNSAFLERFTPTHEIIKTSEFDVLKKQRLIRERRKMKTYVQE